MKNKILLYLILVISSAPTIIAADRDDKESTKNEAGKDSLYYDLGETVNKLNRNLSFSGFIDLNYFPSKLKNNKIEYGQFEIDLSTKLIDKLSFEAALAFDGEKFAPGAGYLDYHFTGDDEGHGARGAFFTHSGFHLGQFDVPFGKYYEQIPSPNRNISTIPAVIEKSISCFNTLGMNAYTNYLSVNLNAYILNGIDGGFVLGGRTGFLITKEIELGGSLMNNFRSEEDVGLAGLDISINTEILQFSSEFIWSKGISGCEVTNYDQTHFGYYLENRFMTSQFLPVPIDLIIRYGSWKADYELIDSPSDIKHYDITVDYTFVENLLIKLEYHSNTYNGGFSDDNTYGLQVVLIF